MYLLITSLQPRPHPNKVLLLRFGIFKRGLWLPLVTQSYMCDKEVEDSMHILNKVRLTLFRVTPSLNCQETKINTVPLNSGNEMSAVPNTGLVASLKRYSLSEKADNSITTGPDIITGCCFHRRELALPFFPVLYLLPTPSSWGGFSLSILGR